MKARGIAWTWVAVTLVLTLACTASQEARRRQGAASRNLGEAYMSTGDYTSALRELLKAETLTPNDPFLQNDLGLTYWAKGGIDRAIQHFKKAIELKPDYTPAKNNLGAAHMVKKDWDMAISIFKEITGDLLYATPQFPLTNLGVAYYNKKEYLLAEKYYRQALKVAPNSIKALRGLGQTQIATGKYLEAVTNLEKALKIDPRLAETYFDLAHAYALTKDYKKAVAAYSKIVELVPDTPMAASATAGIKAIGPLKQ